MTVKMNPKISGATIDVNGRKIEKLNSNYMHHLQEKHLKHKDPEKLKVIRPAQTQIPQGSHSINIK